jgi:hypothetical protein
VSVNTGTPSVPKPPSATTKPQLVLPQVQDVEKLKQKVAELTKMLETEREERLLYQQKVESEMKKQAAAIQSLQLQVLAFSKPAPQKPPNTI